MGKWVSHQRTAYKKKGTAKISISEEQIKLLNDIGFEWELTSSRQLAQKMAWEERFEQLKGYKDKNGHSNVPHEYKANPTLANWVKKQRQLYKKGKLSNDRFNLLLRIGFEWSTPRVGWDERVSQLKEYKDKNGHCNVSTLDRDNKQLGKWVHNQRTKYKNEELSPEQIKSLEDIGFKWVTSRRYKPSCQGVDAAETENLVSDGDTSSSEDTQMRIPLHRLPPIVWPATKSSNP